MSAFGVEKEDILRISAKTGLGVSGLLDALVDRVPPPKCAPRHELTGNIRKYSSVHFLTVGSQQQDPIA